MRKYALTTLLLLSGCSKEPNVAVRIDCGDYNDKGLHATLNGQPVGDCPLDIMVYAGEVHVSARKDNEDASYLFAESKMILAENVKKQINLDIQPVYSEEYYYRYATDITGMQAYLEKQPDGKRKAELEARLKAERAKLDNFAPGLVMVQIPTGSFMMGCSEGDSKCSEYEKPRHEVTVPAFKLSKTEVTFAQYDAFARDTKRELPKDEGWGRGNRPVINVNWHDALAYTTWLSEQTGQKFRLPNEAEWEYAARAGTTSKYSWGDVLGSNNANCNGCGSRWDNEQTSPVASFSANSFGLHDMHGNVWEWTQDCWNDNYIDAPANGSAWKTSKCYRRVLRGGSCYSKAAGLLAWKRFSFVPDHRHMDWGFRVAQD